MPYIRVAAARHIAAKTAFLGDGTGFISVFLSERFDGIYIVFTARFAVNLFGIRWGKRNGMTSVMPFPKSDTLFIYV